MKNLTLLALIILLIGCNAPNSQTAESTTDEDSQTAESTTDEDSSAAESEAVIEEKPAVCIWDKVSVRATPTSKGKWKTSISLGETLTYLGEDAIDSLNKNRKYVKVRLADGTEGWSISDLIIQDGRVAVFLEEKDIYKRPDLLTKSDKKFSQMDIVAISSEQDDWVEITGKRSEGKWIDNGWVKKGELSEKPIDVAVAKFASIAMYVAEDSEKKEKLEEILNNSDFARSSFIPVVRVKLEELNSTEDIILDDQSELDSLDGNL